VSRLTKRILAHHIHTLIQRDTAFDSFKVKKKIIKPLICSQYVKVFPLCFRLVTCILFTAFFLMEAVFEEELLNQWLYFGHSCCWQSIVEIQVLCVIQHIFELQIIKTTHNVCRNISICACVWYQRSLKSTKENISCQQNCLENEKKTWKARRRRKKEKVNHNSLKEYSVNEEGHYLAIRSNS